MVCNGPAVLLSFPQAKKGSPQTMKKILFSIFSAFLLFGCSTKTTVSNEEAIVQTGAKVAATEDDLPECDKDLSGQIFFLMDKEVFVYCKDSSYVNIDLAGADGESCTVEDNGDGTALLTCPDGSEYTIVNGTDGKVGKNGVDGEDGVDGTDGTNGTNGVDGEDGVDGVDGAKGVGFDAATSKGSVTVKIELRTADVDNNGTIENGSVIATQTQKFAFASYENLMVQTVTGATKLNSITGAGSLFNISGADTLIQLIRYPSVPNTDDQSDITAVGLNAYFTATGRIFDVSLNMEVKKSATELIMFGFVPNPTAAAGWTENVCEDHLVFNAVTAKLTGTLDCIGLLVGETFLDWEAGEEADVVFTFDVSLFDGVGTSTSWLTAPYREPVVIEPPPPTDDPTPPIDIPIEVL